MSSNKPPKPHFTWSQRFSHGTNMLMPKNALLPGGKAKSYWMRSQFSLGEEETNGGLHWLSLVGHPQYKLMGELALWLIAGDARREGNNHNPAAFLSFQS